MPREDYQSDILTFHIDYGIVPEFPRPSGRRCYSFLDLPGELRNRIYVFICKNYIESTIRTLNVNKWSRLLTHGPPSSATFFINTERRSTAESRNRFSADWWSPIGACSLAKTCRQIQYEVQYIMSTTLTTPNLMCASGRYQPPPIFEHWSKWTFVVRSAVELVIPTIKDYTPSGSPDSRVPAVAGDSFTITHPFETVLNPPHTPFPLNLAWGYVDTILLDVGLLPISGLASPLQALPKVSDFVIETLAAWYSPPPRSEDKLFTFTKSTSSQHANHQWKFIKRYELCNESIELVAQTSCKKPTRFHDPQ